MDCPNCGTKMKTAINADLYACRNCRRVFSGLDLRNKGKGRTWQQFLREAEHEFTLHGEKILTGEML